MCQLFVIPMLTTPSRFQNYFTVLLLTPDQEPFLYYSATAKQQQYSATTSTPEIVNIFFLVLNNDLSYILLMLNQYLLLNATTYLEMNVFPKSSSPYISNVNVYKTPAEQKKINSKISCFNPQMKVNLTYTLLTHKPSECKL